MLGNLLGGEDFLIVVIIALVIFGAGQLPKIARNLGEAQKELKKAMRDDEDDPAPAKPGATAEPGAAAKPGAAAEPGAGAEAEHSSGQGTV